MSSKAKKTTLETSVADAILQRRKTFTAGGYEYEVAPPSPATLILISELCAELPPLKTDSDENVLQCVLRNAKDLSVLGKIVATLIIGAKAIREFEQAERDEAKSNGFWYFCRKAKSRKPSKVDELAEWLMENATPSELNAIVVSRLADMQIGDFFGLTASLAVQNHLKATKEAETQYGD